MNEARTLHLPTRRWAGTGLLVLVALGMSACGALRLTTVSAVNPPAEKYSGFTKVATSEHYIVVVNVLPAEEMFTPAENARLHPTVGELVIDGKPTPRSREGRHTEAHIYAKDTGLVLSNVRPQMTLIDRNTGQVRDVDATLMQDVIVGEPDLHFGSNIVIPSGHEITIVVDVGSERVSIDGKVH